MWQWWSLLALLACMKDSRLGIWVDGAHILAPKWAHEGGYTKASLNENQWEVPYVVEFLATTDTTILSQDLASKMSMTTSSYRGFHTDLQLHLTISTSIHDLPTMECRHDHVSDIMLLFLLPAGAFVDEHELESRHQFHDLKGGNGQVASVINVHTFHANSNPELMAEMAAAQVDVTVMALELIGIHQDTLSSRDSNDDQKETPRCDSNSTVHEVSFTIPVHLRYHRANDSMDGNDIDSMHDSPSDTTHAKVTVPLPLVFLRPSLSTSTSTSVMSDHSLPSIRRYYDKSFLGNEGNVKEMYFQQPWNCPMSMDVPVAQGDVSVSGDMMMTSESQLSPGAPTAGLAQVKWNGTQEEMERLCLTHLAKYRLLPLVIPSSTTTEDTMKEDQKEEKVMNTPSMVDKEGQLKEHENEEEVVDKVVVEMETKLVIDEQGKETVTLVPKEQKQSPDQQSEESPEQKPQKDGRGYIITPRKDEVKFKVKETEKTDVEGLVGEEEVAELVADLLPVHEASMDDTTTPAVVVDDKVDAGSSDVEADNSDMDSENIVVDADKGDEEEWVDEWAGFEDLEEVKEESPVNTLSPSQETILQEAKSEETILEEAKSKEAILKEVILEAEEAMVAGSILNQPMESEMTPDVTSDVPHDPHNVPEDPLEPGTSPDGEQEKEQGKETKEDGVVELDEVVVTPAVEIPAVEGEMVVEEEKEKEKEKEKEEIEGKVAIETDTKVLSEEMSDNKDAVEGETTSVHLDDHDSNHENNHDNHRDNQKHDAVDMEVNKDIEVEGKEGVVLDTTHGLEDGISTSDVEEDKDDDNDKDDKDEDDESETSTVVKDSKSETKDSESIVEHTGDDGKEGVTVLVPIATVPPPPISAIFGDDIGSMGDHFLIHFFRHREQAHRNTLEFHFFMVATATVFLYALAALAITCSLLVRI